MHRLWIQGHNPGYLLYISLPALEIQNMTGLLPVKITCWLSKHTYCFTKLLRFLQTDLLAWSIKICKGNKYQELKQTLQGKIKRGIFYMTNNKNWLTKINHLPYYTPNTLKQDMCALQ